MAQSQDPRAEYTNDLDGQRSERAELESKMCDGIPSPIRQLLLLSIVGITLKNTLKEPQNICNFTSHTFIDRVNRVRFLGSKTPF